jgi:hypothetical protein
MERIKPRALVLGTSRSQFGIRMTHPGWDPAAVPRYNLAFESATTHEIYAYLRHAQAVRPLRQVVLGLDTWQLTTDPSDVRPGFEAAFLDSPGSVWRHLASRIARLRIDFSLDTTLASILTLAHQTLPTRNSFAPNGQQLGEIFYHEVDQEFIKAGPGTVFQDVDRYEILVKLGGAPGPKARAGSVQSRRDLASMEYLREIIAFCRANAIDLRIFITPMHAHQMEIAAALGEWRRIETGKRMLVQILAEDAAGDPGAKPYPLWDFTGYNAVTDEPVPSPGSQQEMAYYWDSSHFKEAVGDWVLDRLFDIPDDVPADFGVPLTPQSVDRVLEQIRTDRAIYVSEHPADAAEIRSLAEEVYRALPERRRPKNFALE